MPDNSLPILDFDPQRKAIIEPQPAPLSIHAPEKALLCFFHDVLSDLVSAGRLEEVGALRSEMGRLPIYQLTQSEEPLLVVQPGVGAPLCAGFLEELIALGVTQFIACGGCGVLDPAHDVGALFIPTSAVRDEGTSYHYLPPDSEVNAHPRAVSALQAACEDHQLPYKLVKTWTTDAIYRETIQRRNLRMQQGCEVVEMEAAAFFAVAQFRGVEFGQILYGGDLVLPEGWDARSWNDRMQDRERLFWLGVEALLRL